MKIQEVVTSKHETDFLKTAGLIYKNDAEWIPHLDKDIREIFDPAKNQGFVNGEAARWILYNENDKPVGRIAAFYDRKSFKEGELKTGGCGFFECVDDQGAGDLLFDIAKKWLQDKGIQAMEGPVNFGEKDKFWGLMTAGFKHPSYQENYNPPYYQALFETYGFEKTTEQTTSEIVISDFDYERFNRLSSRVLNNPAYHFEHYKDKDLKRFATDFITIYNQAWAHRPDFKPLTTARIETTLRSLRPILKEDFIWFAYAHGEPAGFYINVIDVNQIFRYLGGKFDFWAKLKFLWFRKFAEINRLRGIVFGVIPKYQNLGLETGMIMKFYETIVKYPKLTSSELAWIGDFNPKMHSLFKALGAKTTKVHYTYRKVF